MSYDDFVSAVFIFALMVLILLIPVIAWSGYLITCEMRECAANNATFVHLSDGRNVCLKNNSYWEPQP